MSTQLSRKANRKKGQGLTEYGIILVLVAVAGIGVFAIFGNQIKSKVGQITAAVTGDQDAYNKAKEKADSRIDQIKEQVDEENSMKGTSKSLKSE